MVGGNVDEDLKRRGLSLVRRHGAGKWGFFVAYVVLNVLGQAAILATPFAVGRAVDAAIEGQLGPHLWLLLAVVSISSVASLAQALLTRFTTGVTMSVTTALLGKAFSIGIPGRRPFTHGELLNRVGSDVQGPATYPRIWLSVTINMGAAVISILALALIDWAFVPAFFLAVALVVLMFSRLVRRLVDDEVEMAAKTDILVNRFVDALGGRRTIEACGTFQREVDRITEPLPSIVAAGKRLGATAGGALLGLLLSHYGLLVAMTGVGAWSLGQGRIGAGGLLAAIQYGQLAFARAQEILNFGWFHLASNRVRSGRVLEVLETSDATPAPEYPAPLPAGAGSAELNGVVVSGEPQPVLQECELRVPAGSTIAIVGKSGAGKSTIAALIGRLLDPDEGAVVLDQKAVSEVDPEELARAVTYAFERPALLGRTVRDTIALGTDATDDQVEAAAQAVAADEFITHLPRGYDTPLEETPLSGGERQRLGLARAALRRARISAFDDATSSLDTATEARVHESLRILSEGRTTLIVAHRASTAARADLVAWLVDGRIRRVAAHRELWKDPDYQAAFASSVPEPE